MKFEMPLELESEVSKPILELPPAAVAKAMLDRTIIVASTRAIARDLIYFVIYIYIKAV
jgi:hypothetical protein